MASGSDSVSDGYRTDPDIYFSEWNVVPDSPSPCEQFGESMATEPSQQPSRAGRQRPGRKERQKAKAKQKEGEKDARSKDQEEEAQLTVPTAIGHSDIDIQKELRHNDIDIQTEIQGHQLDQFLCWPKLMPWAMMWMILLMLASSWHRQWRQLAEMDEALTHLTAKKNAEMDEALAHLAMKNYAEKHSALTNFAAKKQAEMDAALGDFAVKRFAEMHDIWARMDAQLSEKDVILAKKDAQLSEKDVILANKDVQLSLLLVGVLALMAFVVCHGSVGKAPWWFA